MVHSNINHYSLIDILTLRYDSKNVSSLPKKQSNDFLPKYDSVDLSLIENLISNHIFNSVQKNDDNISVALSGGVDSTLVISLLRKIFPNVNINSITVKFSNSVDESENALKISEKFEANHQIIEIDNYLSELPKAISIIESPFWDLHWYYVTKKAKSLSKTLFSGDGGDEIFGGYTFRYEKFLKITNHSSTPLEKVKAYLQCHERDRVDDQEKIFGSKINFSWDYIYKKLLPFFDNNLSNLDQVFYADYNGKLRYNFNPINSKIAKNFNLKLSTPLLNSDLINYGCHLHNNLKYNFDQNLGKLPLRQLIKKLGYENLLHNNKLGFNVNTENLWSTLGYAVCTHYFEKSRLVEDKLIEKEWIEKYLHTKNLPIKYINKFFGLLATEVWYRLFITKDMKSNEKLEI